MLSQIGLFKKMAPKAGDSLKQGTLESKVSSSDNLLENHAGLPGLSPTHDLSTPKGALKMTDSNETDMNSQGKEAVALKLMQHIGALENEPEHVKNKREYWLMLYRQCFRAVNGRRAKRKSAATTQP